MKRLLLLLVVLSLATVSTTSAQVPPALGSEIVRVEDGALIYESYGVLEIRIAGSEVQNLRVRIHGEAASEDIISATRFSALSASLAHMAVITAAAESVSSSAAEFLDGTQFRLRLAELAPEEVDLDVELLVTSEAVDVTVSDLRDYETFHHQISWTSLLTQEGRFPTSY